MNEEDQQDTELKALYNAYWQGLQVRNNSEYLYVLDIYKEHSEDFVGFGITNIPNERLRVHRNNLQKQGKRINYSHLFIGRGRQVLATESEIKRTFEIIGQGVAGFIKEAVSSNDRDLLLDFVEQRLDKVVGEEYDSLIN